MVKLMTLAAVVLLVIYYFTVILYMLGLNVGVFQKGKKMNLILAFIPYFYWIFWKNKNKPESPVVEIKEDDKQQ